MWVQPGKKNGQFAVGADIAPLKRADGVLANRNDSSKRSSPSMRCVGPGQGGELVHNADDVPVGGLGQPPLGHLFGFGRHEGRAGATS